MIINVHLLHRQKLNLYLKNINSTPSFQLKEILEKGKIWPKKILLDFVPGLPVPRMDSRSRWYLQWFFLFFYFYFFFPSLPLTAFIFLYFLVFTKNYLLISILKMWEVRVKKYDYENVNRETFLPWFIHNHRQQGLSKKPNKPMRITSRYD